MFKEHARRTPAVFEAFLLVFEPGDVARWNKLPAILATLGTKLEIAPYPPDKMRNAIVLHLLKLACAPGLISKNNYTDHFRLNTDDRCGSLASNPEVDSVNGHNLFTDTQAAFASVTKDCEAGAEVTLSRSGQADVRTMSCTKPLQQPPTFKLAGP